MFAHSLFTPLLSGCKPPCIKARRVPVIQASRQNKPSSHSISLAFYLPFNYRTTVQSTTKEGRDEKIHAIYKNIVSYPGIFSNVSIFYSRTDFTRRRRNIPLRFKIFTRARVRIVSAKFPMAPGQTVQTEEKIFTDWRRGTILSKISSIDSIKIYQELSIVQISIIHRPIVGFHTPRDILIIRNKIFHLRISWSSSDSHRHVLPSL